MRQVLILAGALSVMACAAVAPEGQTPEGQRPEQLGEDRPAPAHGEGVCNPAPVQDLIGRQRSDALGAEAMRRSGARTLRWILPDSAYTMDFREDRINIDVELSGRITRLRCF